MDQEMQDDVRSEDMPRHINEHMGKHRHMFGRGGCYWASWDSPVGLGIFLLTSALGAAIAIYALFNLISGIISLTRPAPTYSYPGTMEQTQPIDGTNTQPQ